MTTQELQALLVAHDDGVLKYGKHEEGSREFCALEFDSLVRGRLFSDNAITLPDLRPLNDAFGEDDSVRTRELLPVMAALWDWVDWSPARRHAWVNQIMIGTVQQIISKLPNIGAEVAQLCRTAQTVEEVVHSAALAVAAASATWSARSAASAARSAALAASAAESAASAAAWSARSARSAASAASEASEEGNDILHVACVLWCEAAEQTSHIV